MNSIATASPDIVSARLARIAVAAYLALIVLTLLWEGWLAPARYAPPGVWLTLKALPLLLPLWSLLRGRPTAFVWASLMLLLYFIEGIVLAFQYRHEAWSLHATLPYALLEIVLCTIFFVSGAYYSRRRGRQLAETSDRHPDGT